MAAIPTLSVAWTAWAGSLSAEIGLDDLIKRIGEQNIPTGAGLAVAMPEAGETYYPDQTLPEVQGKIFHEMSSSSGVSGHATTVARRFYGSENKDGQETSVAPGIPEI